VGRDVEKLAYEPGAIFLHVIVFCILLRSYDHYRQQQLCELPRSDTQ
jgi:hypothetical protein